MQSTILSAGGLGLVGSAVALVAGVAFLPNMSSWSAAEYANVGGVVGLTFFSVMLLRSQGRKDKTHSDAIKSMADGHAAASKANTETFQETVKVLIEDNKQERKASRETMNVICQTHREAQQKTADAVAQMVERCSGTLAKRET